jgi:hypothetical protein
VSEAVGGVAEDARGVAESAARGVLRRGLVVVALLCVWPLIGVVLKAVWRDTDVELDVSETFREQLPGDLELAGTRDPWGHEFAWVEASGSPGGAVFRHYNYGSGYGEVALSAGPNGLLEGGAGDDVIVRTIAYRPHAVYHSFWLLWWVNGVALAVTALVAVAIPRAGGWGELEIALGLGIPAAASAALVAEQLVSSTGGLGFELGPAVALLGPVGASGLTVWAIAAVWGYLLRWRYVPRSAP